MLFFFCTDMTDAAFKDVYMTAFKKMYNVPTRQRNKEVIAEIKKWPKTCQEKMSKVFEATDKHRRLVRHVMQKLPDVNVSWHSDYKKKNWHDWSKTRYYVFITSGVNDFNIQTDEVMQEFKRVKQQHYIMESHHHQFERDTGRECSDYDLREMAVDHIATNLQKNNGIFIRNILEMYEPEFTYHHEKKVLLYRQYVEAYLETVRTAYVKHFICPELPSMAYMAYDNAYYNAGV